MSFLDRVFGPAAPVSLALPATISLFESRLSGLEQKFVDIQLVRARLADGYRDANLDPMDPTRFEDLAFDLDLEALRRVAVVSTAFESDELRRALAALARRTGVQDQVCVAFLEVARDRKLLTLELLRSSPARLEEFTRAWIAALGAEVAGETPAESAERLQHLDYSRLLAEADRAQRAAQERKQAFEALRARRDRPPNGGKP